jgi:hypothetical protein
MMFIEVLSAILIMLLMHYPLYRCDSEYQVHIMGCVPYVGWVTCSRATMMTHFVCLKGKKKKKGCHRELGEDRQVCAKLGPRFSQ